MATNQPTQAEQDAKAAEQAQQAQQQAIDAAVAEALEKQRAAYEADAARTSGGDSSSVTPDQGDDRAEYVLEADHGVEVTSAPGKPLTYRDVVKGDTIRLDAVRAAELLAAGAISDPNAEVDEADEPGAQTEAPRERRPRRRS